MKTISLMFMCALFAGCSSVSHTSQNTNGTAAYANSEPQYHAHVVTEYSDGATQFLEMSPDDDTQ